MKILRTMTPVCFLSLAVAGCGEGHPEWRASELMEANSSPIVGGSVDNGHPAVALLYNQAEGYLCSGTVIDSRVYLTAAHCVTDTNAANYLVGGGTDLINDNPDWVVEVSEVVAHPDYDPQGYGDDVGILVLKQTPPVTPMAWQKTYDDGVYDLGNTFTAVGYGVTSGGGGGDGVKRSVTLTIEETYSNAYGYGSSTKNTCSGDSGGPALRVLNGVETVIGTVSFGDANCSENGYDMQTDYHADFIQSFMGAGGGGGGTPTPTPTATPNPTPTPTPGGGGNGGDDDDGEHGLFACSVGGLGGSGSPVAVLALFGLIAVAGRARRRS